MYASDDYLPFFKISDSEWPLKKLSEASPFQKELEWELERPEISNEFFKHWSGDGTKVDYHLYEQKVAH